MKLVREPRSAAPAKAPRFAGWSLTAAEAMVAGARESAIPLLAGRGEVDGRPAAYVCRHHVCAAPITDPAALA